MLSVLIGISPNLKVDEGGIKGRAATTNGITEIHRLFCEELPGELLWVKSPDNDELARGVAGEFREKDARVGRHVGVSPGAVPRFMEYFENAYGSLKGIELIVAMAAAHHRMVWIHPFMDGNGRVVRLMSHAMLLEALDSGGVWSVARRLARDTKGYKTHLQNSDEPRRGDSDGRGSLSEYALASFSKYFLETCIDQVNFMESLVSPDRLKERMVNWSQFQISGGRLPKQSTMLLEAILYRSEIPRGELPPMLQVSPRTARRVASELLNVGILTSDSTRSPLRIAFPASLASEIMPGLFPDKQ